MTTIRSKMRHAVAVLPLLLILAGCATAVRPGEDPHPSRWVGIADASGTAASLACLSSPASAAIAISTATSTAVVAAAAGKTVYVCGFALTAAGTTPTAEIETGTQTTAPCDTGTIALTGAMAPSVGGELRSAGGRGVQIAGNAGAQLCIVSGGTTPSLQGYLTYVQQ